MVLYKARNYLVKLKRKIRCLVNYYCYKVLSLLFQFPAKKQNQKQIKTTHTINKSLGSPQKGSYRSCTQFPSSGGICRRSLFWRSRVLRFSISFIFWGSTEPTWLLLIRTASNVGMWYRTGGSTVNLLRYKKDTSMYWAKGQIILKNRWLKCGLSPIFDFSRKQETNFRIYIQQTEKVLLIVKIKQKMRLSPPLTNVTALGL